jgi:hypothetical protein
MTAPTKFRYSRHDVDCRLPSITGQYLGANARTTRFGALCYPAANACGVGRAIVGPWVIGR